MSKELVPPNIQINVIRPSQIASKLIKAIPTLKIVELISKQLIKRLGTYDYLTNSIIFSSILKVLLMKDK